MVEQTSTAPADARVHLLGTDLGRGWVLKAGREGRPVATPDGQASLGRECSLYRAIARRPDLARCAPTAVEIPGAGDRRRALLVHALPGHRPLDPLRDSAGRDYAEAGAVLARWHRDAGRLPGLDSALPGVLGLPAGQRVQSTSAPGTSRLAAAVSDDLALCALLSEVACRWQPTTTMHGDIRTGTVLLRDAPFELRLVDWDSCGWGDPTWDLACLLVAPVSGALAAGVDLDDPAQLAVVAAALTGYGWHGPAPVEHRWRPFLAAALVQHAFAVATCHPTATATVRRLVELARTLARGGRSRRAVDLVGAQA